MSTIPRIFLGHAMMMAVRIRNINGFCVKCQKKLRFPSLNLVGSVLFTSMATPAIGKSFGDATPSISEGRNQISQEMTVIYEADKLIENNNFAQAYSLLYPYKDSNNEEILWRLAETIYELSQKKKTSTEAKDMAADGFLIISRAMEINNRHSEVHKWMAVLMDAYYKEISVKARLAHVVQVKKHMIIATEINPNDPLTWYMLGWWCFKLADLPWAHRQIAKLIYGDPPKATFEEALKYFQKAESVSTNYRGMNFVMIGKTYLKLGQKENAEINFRMAVHRRANNDEDRQSQTKAKSYLSKLGTNIS